MSFVSEIFLVVVVLLLAQSEAAKMDGEFSDPSYPGKCVYDGLILDSGQTGTTKSCYRFMCEEKSIGSVQTCSPISLPDEMKLGKYKAPKANYPDCCVREVLDSFGKVLFAI